MVESVDDEVTSEQSAPLASEKVTVPSGALPLSEVLVTVAVRAVGASTYPVGGALIDVLELAFPTEIAELLEVAVVVCASPR